MSKLVYVLLCLSVLATSCNYSIVPQSDSNAFKNELCKDADYSIASFVSVKVRSTDNVDAINLVIEGRELIANLTKYSDTISKKPSAFLKKLLDEQQPIILPNQVLLKLQNHIVSDSAYHRVKSIPLNKLVSRDYHFVSTLSETEQLALVKLLFERNTKVIVEDVSGEYAIGENYRK